MSVTDYLLLADGVMLATTETGDINPETEPAAGLYIADTRLLSKWRMQIDDQRLHVGATSATSFRRRQLLLPDGPRNRPDAIAVERDQQLDGGGLTETVVVRNTTAQPTRRHIHYTAEIDFADQFQVRTDGRRFDRSAGRRQQRPISDGVEFTWTRSNDEATFAATARITTSPPATHHHIDDLGTRFGWTVDLPGHAETRLQIRVDNATTPPARSMSPTIRRGPKLSDPCVTMVRDCSRSDLESLLIDAPHGSGDRIPAAGAPWFLTMFGRDALLTSVLAGTDSHDFRPAVLRALAATQGHRDDARSLEQPGRIVHEIRAGELATLGDVPYRRYYGSVDVTALYLAVLGRTALGEEAHPEGHDLAVELQDSALAAIRWLRSRLDDNGFVSYRSDPGGLINQGWKDSEDSTTHADGQLARGRIALCEVQGYTWDALRRSADMAHSCWHQPDLAIELATLADQLRQRFLDRFWMPGRQFPAMALEGTGHQVDGLGSNAGHLLWSGILPIDKANHVADRLLSDQFWTGWGIRTLAADQHRYSPLAYHNGSVWPHDSMLTALGINDIDRAEDAHRIAQGAIACAAAVGGHLPELIGGFSRAQFPQPVTYRFAGKPQAWAAAAGLAATRLESGN